MDEFGELREGRWERGRGTASPRAQRWRWSPWGEGPSEREPRPKARPLKAVCLLIFADWFFRSFETVKCKEHNTRQWRKTRKCRKLSLRSNLLRDFYCRWRAWMMRWNISNEKKTSIQKSAIARQETSHRKLPRSNNSKDIDQEKKHRILRSKDEDHWFYVCCFFKKKTKLLKKKKQ